MCVLFQRVVVVSSGSARPSLCRILTRRRRHRARLIERCRRAVRCSPWTAFRVAPLERDGWCRSRYLGPDLPAPLDATDERARRHPERRGGLRERHPAGGPDKERVEFGGSPRVAAVARGARATVYAPPPLPARGCRSPAHPSSTAGTRFPEKSSGSADNAPDGKSPRDTPCGSRGKWQNKTHILSFNSSSQRTVSVRVMEKPPEGG